MTNRSATRILDDLRQEASEAGERTRRRIAETARSLPYAALGSMSASAQRSRRAARALFELPGDLLERAQELPERLRDGFWVRAGEGRDLVARVRRREGFGRARKKARKARSATRCATTAARQAAGAAARAANQAAASVDPSDTRAYEERTVEELYDLASARGVEGRSQMNKAELIRSLRAQR